MKKMLFALTLCIMICTAVHAQQTIVIQRPGIFTELASAAGTIVSFPFAVVEGVVVGAVEATGSLIQGSTEVIVVQSATPVPTRCEGETGVKITEPSSYADADLVTVVTVPSPCVVMIVVDGCTG